MTMLCSDRLFSGSRASRGCHNRVNPTSHTHVWIDIYIYLSIYIYICIHIGIEGAPCAYVRDSTSMMLCMHPRDTSPHQDSAGTAPSGTPPRFGCTPLKPTHSIRLERITTAALRRASSCNTFIYIHTVEERPPPHGIP